MTTALWTAQALVAATDGVAIRLDWQASGLSIDSRTLVPGDLFIALKGMHHDGHDHVAAALSAGAAGAIVCHESATAFPPDAPLVRVRDSFAALEAIGQAARNRSTARIAAVTGSIGKTGSKETLAFLLNRQAPAFASQGNNNNRFGVPLSLGRLPQQAGFAVFELGMSHEGEIAPLAQQVRPHVALVTTIAPAHLEFFTDIAAIAKEKASIATGLQPGGCLVLPADSDYLTDMRSVAQGARIVTFGQSALADVRLIDQTNDETGSDVTIALQGQALSYRLGTPGKHWVANSLGIMACLAALNADLEQAACDYALVRAPKGRGARYDLLFADGRNVRVIDESYNANPITVRAAVDVLAMSHPHARGRRVLALGDMLELGPNAAALHAGLAQGIAAAAIDRVYLAGPLMQNLAERLPCNVLAGHWPESSELIQPLIEDLRTGDVVSVKGSLDMRMGAVVQALLARGEPDRAV